MNWQTDFIFDHQQIKCSSFFLISPPPFVGIRLSWQENLNPTNGHTSGALHTSSVHSDAVTKQKRETKGGGILA